MRPADREDCAVRCGQERGCELAAQPNYMCLLAAYIYMCVCCYAVGCMGVCGTALLGRDVAAVEPAVSVGAGPG